MMLMMMILMIMIIIMMIRRCETHIWKTTFWTFSTGACTCQEGQQVWDITLCGSGECDIRELYCHGSDKYQSWVPTDCSPNMILVSDCSLLPCLLDCCVCGILPACLGIHEQKTLEWLLTKEGHCMISRDIKWLTDVTPEGFTSIVWQIFDEL